MYQTFIVGKQPPIYDPHEFRKFCFSSGAPTLFDTILAAVTSSRHSQNRVHLNEKRIVAFIYNMCYCLSQQCNAMQVDHALYLHSSRITQEGIDTENQMGNTCSRRTINSALNSMATQTLQHLNSFLLEASRNEWLLVLIIDDYTNIHTHRRPKGNHPTSANNMCTIVIKAFKNVNAIKLPSTITSLHNQQGVDLDACKEVICSNSQMLLMANTYASTMPDWMVTQFFQPESERNRISVHEYCQSTSVRTMRKMDNLHLVDFVELKLKSKENFNQAFEIVLKTNIKLYMQKFILIQPGDWPSQFFSRQLVYEQVTNHVKLINAIRHQQNVATVNQPTQPSSITSSVPPMASVVPVVGPLHISINSREHVLLSFHPFFKNVYQHLFPTSKFAEKPKPWCISLVLEVVYGGWTLIRDTTRKVYNQCKDLQYGTLLNLLDNYIPLVLSIYAVSFKSNMFDEFFNGMIRIWIMFTSLKRRNYNKATLVWIANILHWKKSFPEMYNLFKNWLTISDEYPVENTHSIIRAQTKHSDTATQLTRKVKSIFQSKAKQMNFRSTFTPPKHFSFSHGQLKYLKLKCSIFLTDLLSKIANNPSNTSFQFSKNKNNGRKLTVIMPEIFGERRMKDIVLPFGFHGEIPPDEDMKCDLPCCKVKSDEWSILQGCWHSFHDKCLGDLSHCPLCKTLVKQKIEQLGKVAREAIFNGKSSATIDGEIMPDNEGDDDDDDDDDGSSNTIPNVEPEYMEETITSLNRRINCLKPSAPDDSNYQASNVLNLPRQQPASSDTVHSAKGETTTNSRNLPRQQPASSDTLHSAKGETTTNCQMPSKHKSSTYTSNQEISHQQTDRSVTLIRYDYPGVIEWILPYNLSQSQILGQFLGSNACTIISVLGAIKLARGMIFPSTINELSTCVTNFACTMEEGNFLYEDFNVDPQQPNLEVRDVVEKMKSLSHRIEIIEDVGFFSAHDLVKKLEMLVKYGKDVTAVLIVPPDKSMLIFIKDGKIGLMDSHEHGVNGAIIAVSSSSSTGNFVDYISGMVHRYWGTSLQGSNFAIIQPQIEE